LKKLILQILQYTLFLGLGILLLYLLLKSIDLKVFVNSLKTVRYEYVILSLVIGFVSFYARAARWNILIEPLGFKPKLDSTYHSMMIGYMANYAFPRIGEVTRCGVLYRTEKVPVDKLLGTVIAERAFDLFVLIVLTVSCIFIKFSLFGKFFTQSIFPLFYAKFHLLFTHLYLFVFVMMGLLLIAFITMYTFRLRILKIALVQKFGRVAKGIFLGLKSIFRLKQKMLFILFTLIIWSSYLFMTYAVLYSIKATSELSVIDALFVLLAGSFGMVAPVQGGIGAYHWMVVLALSIFLIPNSDSVAFAFLSHGSQAIGIILLGGISVLFLFLKKKKENREISM
jgi:glycosyltransferase 2 family protein